KYRYALAAVVISLGIPSIAVFSYFSYIALRGELVATPRGRVTLLYEGTQELLPRIVAAPSSDGYFFYPNMPMLSFLTARGQISKYDILYPGWTTPSQYQDACISVLRHASWLVIDRNWTSPSFERLRLTYPAIPDAALEETE